MSEQQYMATVATFDAAADAYLAHFKDYAPYQPSYDAFLAALQPQQYSLLEVGCGPGQVSHYLLKRRPDLDIMGIDLAPNMIKLAKELNPNAQFVVMDARQINDLKQRFDAIFCGFCLPYLNPADARQWLSDVSEKLHPNGLLYLSLTTGPSDQVIKQTSKRSAGAVYQYHHDLPELKQHLSKLGLKIQCIETMPHTHHEQSVTDVYLLARQTAQSS